MKKITILFFVLFFSFGFGQNKHKKIKFPRNAKIGLSLAGGGAKGFAHVGALKVIDSLGIKIDYISGTSMGAIVGGLYASGYSPKEIEEIVLKTDFYALLNNEKTREEVSFFNKTNDKYILNVPIKKGKINLLPKSISSGQKNIYMLKDLFKNVSHQKDFSKLPIPFMCMATNLETGKLKIFEKGNLVKSIMASAAFPSLLDPVKINDSLYIDGAMTVNYPSKQLKDKGIDIVIGVDLNQGLKTKKELNSAIDILNQVIDFQIQEDTKKQYQYTDLNIKPNLKNYSSVSYDKKDSIIIAGYQAAKNQISSLSRFPKNKIPRLKATYNNAFSNVYKIDSLVIEGDHIFNVNYIKGKMNLKIPSLQTYENINKMIDKLYATNNYKLISYDIESKNNINYFKLNVTENENKFFLKFGLHHDEVYKTGLLINTTIKRLILRNSTISLDVIIGNRPRYYFNYFIDNGYLPSFGASSTGTSFKTKDSNGNETDEWIWFRNKIFFQSTWKDRYAIGFGMSHDYFENNTINSMHFVNPYAFLKTDTRNNKNFPTKGVYLDSKVSLLDLLSKDLENKTFQTNAHFSFNIPINKFITYRANLFGGFSFGNKVPDYYLYRSGGVFEQKIANFNPFYGLYFGSLKSKNVLSGVSELQFQIKKDFYATLQYGMMTHFNNISFENVLSIKQNTVGIQAGYDSPFGQIKLNYSHNFNQKNDIFSVVLGHWF